MPAESIGCWEDLEAAFLDNFQGTYVRPPDADDLSHIIQQPDESARQFWTRFLTKKNQIVDCPDAEALATFKHNIRDEWLARHLGQEKPKSMATLTSLMTRFYAGEDSWLARSNNLTKNPGSSDAKDSNGRSRATSTSAELTVIMPKIRQSMPDSEALNLVSGKSRSKEILRARPIWTEYSIARARYMAPPKNQPTTPIGIVGCSSRQAS